MFCKNCGNQINDNAVVCPNCGCETGVKPTTANTEDTGNIGWGFLGFFFPLIGLILYLVWKDNKPKCAKVAGKGALVGVIIGVVVAIIIGVAYGSIIAGLLSGIY